MNNSQSVEHPRAIPTVIGRSLKAMILESALVSATVLLDMGADIYSLVYRPKNIDVLWKSPLAVREPGVGPTPSGDSLVLWRTYYRGGWQVIFPNFGPACEYKGAPLDVHGEAARTVWTLEKVEETANQVSVTVSLDLLKSPFRIRRTLTLPADQPRLTINETVTNVGPEAMECIWAHHPAFGAPLLSPDCVIDTGARAVEADDDYKYPENDIPPGEQGRWPYIRDTSGSEVDLSRAPGPGSGYTRAIYLKDFAESWYALTNPALGLGVGVVWNGDLFPYACLWQQTGGNVQYPWYGRAYVMAIEPCSSYPGQGLATVITKTGTQLNLAPGETRSLEITAVFYEGGQRVAHIDRAGIVSRR